MTSLKIPKTFALRMRAVRERHGLGINELGAAAGVSPGFISKLEFGEAPGVGVVPLKKIADALGVTMDFLWNGTVPEDPSWTWLMAKAEATGLAALAARSPERWRTSTIVRALKLDLPTNGDGEPSGGWTTVLDDIEAGKYEVRYGDAATVERAVVKQLKRRRPRRRNL